MGLTTQYALIIVIIGIIVFFFVKVYLNDSKASDKNNTPEDKKQALEDEVGKEEMESLKRENPEEFEKIQNESDKYPRNYLLAVKKFQEKMNSDSIKPWLQIITERSKVQVLTGETFNIKMDDYEYWAKGHCEEYEMRFASNSEMDKDDRMLIDEDQLNFRIKIFGEILEMLEKMIDESSKHNVPIEENLTNDYHATISSKKGAELALTKLKKEDKKTSIVDVLEIINYKLAYDDALKEFDDPKFAQYKAKSYVKFVKDLERRDKINNEAYDKYKEGEYLEGVELAKEADKDFDGRTNGRFKDSIAEGYFFLEEYSEALDYSNQAIIQDQKFDESNLAHFLTRAKIYIKIKEFDKARLDLNRALEIEPDYSEAKQILNDIKKD
jgi:tetratricopeptide (TPR) repeat protein